MEQFHHTLTVATKGRGLYDFTSRLRDWLVECDIRTGLLTVFIRHTSASLLIQENWDPDVKGDLERFFARLVRDGDPLFVHNTEGPDDMPAHVRAALTQTHLSIPLHDGVLVLGEWQGVYVYEHRYQPQWRQVVLHLSGE